MRDGTRIDGDATALRGLRAVGTAAAVAFVVLVASIGRLVPFEDTVWRAVLLARGCATDVAVDRVVDTATRSLLALVVGMTVRQAHRHGGLSVWAWTATAGLGLFAGKTLKHLLTRDRPSSLPDVLLGYSFPSAHAMNSVIGLLVVIAFTRDVPGRRWWRAAAALLTTVVIGGRLLLGRHWICDVVGGVLMALAVGGLITPLVGRRPLIAPTAIAVMLVTVFGGERWIAGRGWRLPAPLVGRGLAIVDLDVGNDAATELSGAWRETEREAPGGSFVWLEGAGRIAVDLPATVLAASDAARTPMRLALGARPAVPFAGCPTVTLDVNGRAFPAFVPFSGWREYRLPIAAGVLHAGRNELAIDVRAGDRPWRFAVAYVRLAASGAE